MDLSANSLGGSSDTKRTRICRFKSFNQIDADNAMIEPTGPRKSLLPPWLVEELQSQGILFDPAGRPELQNAPLERPCKNGDRRGPACRIFCANSKTRAGEQKCESVLISSALANDQSDVVVLFTGAELFNPIDNRLYHRLWRQLSVPFEPFDQTLFAEIFPCFIERFRHSVGIQYKGVA
jgi:hypothetical protein